MSIDTQYTHDDNQYSKIFIQFFYFLVIHSCHLPFQVIVTVYNTQRYITHRKEEKSDILSRFYIIQ